MSITENTILEVVRQLAGAGTAPTVRSVREALGGGSNLGKWEKARDRS